MYIVYVHVASMEVDLNIHLKLHLDRPTILTIMLHTCHCLLEFAVLLIVLQQHHLQTSFL